MPHPFDSAEEHAANPGISFGKAEAVKAWGGKVEKLNSVMGFGPRYFPSGDHANVILAAMEGGWLTYLNKVREAGGSFTVLPDKIVPREDAIAAYLALRFCGQIEQPVPFFEDAINGNS